MTEFSNNNHLDRSAPRRPCSVLFLIDELDEWRGTETHLIRLLTALDRERFRPVVAILGRARLAEEFRAAGVVTHTLAIPRVFAPSGLRGLFTIRNLLRRERADLLISYHTAADLLGPPAARLAGVPAISCRRDMGFTKKPIHVACQRWINRLLRGIIAVSRAVARAVETSEGYPAERMRVIWNGEDLERFAAGPSAKRAELAIGPETRLLVCVGGLTPVKDPLTLAGGFAELLKTDPDCCLVMIGEGPLRGELEARAAELGGRLRVLGQREDVADWLRAADIYVQSSLSEGFSNAILQAMATALPVVVTDVGGNPEFVAEGRGALVPAGDAGAMAAALRPLVRSEERRRALGDAARRHVELHASLARMTAAYMDAFSEAIAGGFVKSPR